MDLSYLPRIEQLPAANPKIRSMEGQEPLRQYLQRPSLVVRVHSRNPLALRHGLGYKPAISLPETMMHTQNRQFQHTTVLLIGVHAGSGAVKVAGRVLTSLSVESRLIQSTPLWVPPMADRIPSPESAQHMQCCALYPTATSRVPPPQQNGKHE